jgi:tRNA pseudouridine55 synthase|tara:strand:+ start:1527 stop:2453 length:927 start_codon:yes stop_codon:yes gene_type:complete
MGRGSSKPAGFRDVDGILLLNKPLGITSNKALQMARHLFKANKGGHTGSLDPLASGMLPICFGEAAKFSSYLLDASKSYRAICHLGKTTSTGDAEGEITSESTVNVTEADITAVLKSLTGSIQQIPPMYSALKHKGQPLYRLARKGKEVERAARTVEIYKLAQLSFDGFQLEIDVHCSKGTYIRTIAEDIGSALGCGAFVSLLDRKAVHPYWQEPSYTLDYLTELAEQGLDVLDQCLLPVKSALTDLPELIIDTTAVDLLKNGVAVEAHNAKHSSLLSLVAESGEFIGIGKILPNGLIAPKRLMNTAR